MRYDNTIIIEVPTINNINQRKLGETVKMAIKITSDEYWCE